MILQTLSHLDGTTLMGICSLGASFLFSLTSLCMGLAKSKR